MLWAFDICPEVDSEGTPIIPDVEFKFGHSSWVSLHYIHFLLYHMTVPTRHPKPYNCRLVPRSAGRIAVLEGSAASQAWTLWNNECTFLASISAVEVLGKLCPTGTVMSSCILLDSLLSLNPGICLLSSLSMEDKTRHTVGKMYWKRNSAFDVHKSGDTFRDVGNVLRVKNALLFYRRWPSLAELTNVTDTLEIRFGVSLGTIGCLHEVLLRLYCSPASLILLSSPA